MDTGRVGLAFPSSAELDKMRRPEHVFQRMAQILVIDDDDLVRSTVAACLVHAGHTVTQACDGRAGLRQQRAEPADLIITDIVMPDQDGVGLILALRGEEFAAPIIAMSGGLTNSEAYLGLAQRLGAVRVLGKPFRTADLLQAVDEALAKGKEPGKD